MSSTPASPAAHPCPKCSAPMRTLECNGIRLETCPECRGVFLDRGELDDLLDLESAARTTPDPRPRSVPGEPWPHHQGDDRRSRRSDRDDDDWEGSRG